jgi:DNA processing protein
MGPVSFERLLSRFGAAEVVLGVSREELVGEGGIRGDLAQTIVSSGERLDETLEVLEAFSSCGIRVLFPDSERVPARLNTESDAWHCLMLLGNPSFLESQKLVAMVGRRRATPDGLDFAHRLASELGRREIPTISGMAQGIDRASHLASISVSGGTIGVLPMGILSFLREDRNITRAAEAGETSSLLLVSGAPPWERWSVAEAMRRNSWIASWSDAVVVVEAGDKGGTWKTAAAARRRGKPLWVAQGFSERESGIGNSSLVDALGGHRLDVRESIEKAADRIVESAERAGPFGAK